MKYEVKFPTYPLERKFGKVLSKVHQRDVQEKIMEEVEKLADEPRPGGKKFKALRPPISFYEFAAGYRIRIGDYRVLYDVDDEKKIVWVLALRKRSEGTYK